MTEISALELQVHSEGVRIANERLQSFQVASAGAERAANALAQSVNRFTEVQAETLKRQVAAEEAAQARRVQAAKDAEQKKAQAARAAAEKESATRRDAERAAIADVKRALMTQEQLIRQSENERRRIIISNTEITERQRRELLALSAAKTRRELLAAKADTGPAAGIKGFLGPMIGVGLALGAGRELIETTREFDRLNAGLLTATGSAEGAADAFKALQDLAATTPYSLREMTEAFIKAKNYGLDPSERALISYGNTAASLGKGLTQMIEAVADAQMGEFERLKEFGVKAQQQGDQIKFTFRGVSTTVAKESTAIQNYLIKLGENNFAGAMANRMKTLDGALSNLGDAWDKLVLTISKAGLEDAMTKSVSQLGNLIDKLSTFVEKNKGIAAKLADIYKYYRYISNPLTAAVAAFGGPEEKDAEQKRAQDRLAKYAADAKKVQEQRAQEALDKVKLDLRSREQVLADSFAKELAIIEQGTTTNEAERARLTAQLQTKYAAELEKLQKKSGTAKKAPAPFDLMEMIEMIEVANRHARDQKMLAQFEADAREVEGVEATLQTEEEAIRESYKRRAQIIADNATPEDQPILQARNEAKLAKELRAMREAEAAKRDQLFAEFQTEAEQLQAAEDRKRQIIQAALRDRVIDEQEHAALLARLDEETARKRAQAQAQYAENATQNAAVMFGSLSQVAKNAGGETSAAYAHLFAMQKAFAVASGTINMFRSISEAQAQPFPANIPLALKAAAEGAALLAQISSTNYAGAYDRGGDIPAGQIGLVGERGPELVRGPATVTSRTDTARALGGPSPVNIRIVNAPDHAAAERFLASPQGEKVLVNFVRRNATTIRTMLG